MQLKLTTESKMSASQFRNFHAQASVSGTEAVLVNCKTQKQVSGGHSTGNQISAVFFITDKTLKKLRVNWSGLITDFFRSSCYVYVEICVSQLTQ